MNEELALWAGFTLFILAMLALDLGLFQRRPHVIGMKEALGWFGFWTGLALIFNVGVVFFHERGTEAGLEFFAGFLVEKSLSVDNIFVFILIFSYFRVPQPYQHKVLFWGIVGAIVLRMTFIIGGLALMERFHWTIYVFGTFLLFTGLAMMRKKDEQYDVERNWAIRTFKRFFPITDRYEGNQFFVSKDGRRWATPLFLVLLAIESSDIVFAGRFHPGHLCHHAGSIHCLHLEHLRDAWSACALFRRFAVHADVSFPALWFRLDHHDPWNEDAP
jgi:tellurite resistance protein TerC